MVLKLIKSFFNGNKNMTVVSDDLEVMNAQLNSIVSGLSDYAAIGFGDDTSLKQVKAAELRQILDNIDANSIKHKDATLFFLLGMGYKNYCVWFVRGDDREAVLVKSIFHLNQSIAYGGNEIVQAELGRLLIEEKVVRDYSTGISILQTLKKNGLLPSHLSSVLSKGLRQSGNLELDRTFNLCELGAPSPGVFAEERKRYRALIRHYKKQNDLDKMSESLNQFYSLGVMFSLCYGSHDCKSGVSGLDYEKACMLAPKICSKINLTFQKHGYIEACNYISKNDWKAFVFAFGESEFSISPREMFKV